MFRHILLPTDGSDTAMRAVASGIELALKLGAEVTVMTALEHFPTGIMGSGYRPEGDQDEEPGYQVALERLDRAEQIAGAAGVRCHRILEREQPVYRAILEAAKTSGADLIVMGTRGMGLVERLFIGSETQRVITHTDIPVLTLH